MRGVWRAWIAAMVLGFIPVWLILWLGQPPSLAAGAVLAGLLAAIPGLAALKPTLEAEQFINGMERSSGRVHIVEDTLDWMFRRKLLIETPVGPWRIEGSANPFRHGIVVKPPRTRGTYHVRESPDEAGRVLMARILTAHPTLDTEAPVVAPTEEPRTRRRSARV